MCDSLEQLLLLSLHLCPLQSQNFREKKFANRLFIRSFIPSLPLPHLQKEQEAIWTVTHHQILWGDYAEPHWFTHFRLCWRSMSWQHSPVNTSTKLLILRVLSCFCLPSAVLFVLNSCQQGGKVTNSVPVSNIEFGPSGGVQVHAQQQLIPWNVHWFLHSLIYRAVVMSP